MANHITMGAREAIIRLYEQGWKLRRITRELGLDRKTVRRHIRLWQRSKSPISPTGDEGAKGTIPPTGSETSKGTILHPGTEPPKGTITHAGTIGRPSQCEPYHAIIKAGVDQDLSIQRIFQDLRAENGFPGAYDAVKRYVRRHFPDSVKRIWRMECAPGEEAQVDFGAGASIIDAQGHRHRTYIFRIVLSYSRKAYSEAVYRQDTETFIRCLENAFRHFGGVPRTLVTDNLKAAVTYADWYDPEVNPKLMEFGRHYCIVILPTRPWTPEHKGKVENSVKYVKRNALQGRVFTSLADENRYLLEWEAQIADHRIHGTTRQQVALRFAAEKPVLQPLPPALFPCFHEAQRQVHRDSFVEIAKAYYEVPPEYIGLTIWARWDAHMVRLFNQRLEPIGVLARKQPGEFSTCLGARGRSTMVEHSVEYWRGRIAKLGDYCGLWGERIIGIHGAWGIRVLQGLAALTRHHSAHAIDEACRRALTQNMFRLRQVRALLVTPTEQCEMEFLSEHPLIRDLAEYGAMLAATAPGPACGGHGSDELSMPILATAAGPAQALTQPQPGEGYHA